MVSTTRTKITASVAAGVAVQITSRRLLPCNWGGSAMSPGRARKRTSAATMIAKTRTRRAPEMASSSQIEAVPRRADTSRIDVGDNQSLFACCRFHEPAPIRGNNARPAVVENLRLFLDELVEREVAGHRLC